MHGIRAHLLIAALLICACLVPASHAAAADAPRSAEERGLAFLEVEVPKWARDNHCYSCHNNGDAARALMLAKRERVPGDTSALADTLAFLSKPAEWDANGPDGPFKDNRLARIQFAAALAEASRCGLKVSKVSLDQAAALVAELQSAAGYWETDTTAPIGSPVTYGTTLATVMGMRTLAVATPGQFDQQLRHGRNWLEQLDLKSVLDASAVLWALAEENSAAARRQQARALEILSRGESPDGGWGPFVSSPSEVFDTALALIALSSQATLDSKAKAWLARGRKFLLDRQRDDGSWPPTTRPSGGESYAGQLSTTAWAVQALFATRGK
ncbi:MAG TPA: hypothetical protein VL175_19695 [Pirellulales bacterium]|jgi:hypothetical protein|nr:hypothetical protein [Pirellulales bacterium]